MVLIVKSGRLQFAQAVSDDTAVDIVVSNVVNMLLDKVDFEPLGFLAVVSVALDILLAVDFVVDMYNTLLKLLVVLWELVLRSEKQPRLVEVLLESLFLKHLSYSQLFYLVIFLKISIFYDSASGLLNERNIRKALQFKYEMQIERSI